MCVLQICLKKNYIILVYILFSVLLFYFLCFLCFLSTNAQNKTIEVLRSEDVFITFPTFVWTFLVSVRLTIGLTCQDPKSISQFQIQPILQGWDSPFFSDFMYSCLLCYNLPTSCYNFNYLAIIYSFLL